MPINLLLIDADIVAYRAAASCEPTKTKPDRLEEWVAIGRVHETMQRIIDNLKCNNYKAYLTGNDNFRYLIDPEYKANRKDIQRPTYLEACREFLVTKYGAKLTYGYEADDAIGMEHNTRDTCVCSIDKDLLQLPGFNYDFVKDVLINVTTDTAKRKFYELMLTGDKSDNIRGIYGIGPVKACAFMDRFTDFDELHNAVREVYADDIRFENNLKLVRVLRSQEEYDTIIKEIDENQFSKGQGEEPTEIDSDQATSPIPTVNP